MPGSAVGGPRPQRFAIRVDPLFRGLFTVLGADRDHDYVEVAGRRVVVRLGWLFRMDVAAGAVLDARHHADMVGAWGAHGWRGRWLVNGSSRGIVEVDLARPQRAWLLGLWPLRLRTLFVSLDDPEGFLGALSATGPAPPTTPLADPGG